MSLWPTDPEAGFAFICHRYIGSVLTVVLSIVAFMSPLAMVVLPKLGKLLVVSLRTPRWVRGVYGRDNFVYNNNFVSLMMV